MRTLEAFSGPLSKLDYIAELRSNGDYEHWGLSRVHGDSAAKAAISNAHTQVWLEVLRKPLPALLEELQSLRNENTAEDMLISWREKQARLVPSDTIGGSKRHFNSILLALSLLAQSAEKNNRRAA